MSGGEWQKLAISRAIYRDNNIVVFDEPTAAIDPISEYEIFNNLKQIDQGKIIIFISHRLNTTKYADRIAVMKGGEIIELGTHEELIKEGTEYQKLYQLSQKNDTFQTSVESE
ncbi:Alpha-hemolysin translocation ATP-binding protein HlyB [compost metagenome]